MATNRFEEKLGVLKFRNDEKGIGTFLNWIEVLARQKSLTPIFGIEGSGGNGELLTKHLVSEYSRVYEVNSILTKSRRTFGTCWDKSDERDVKLIVEILTRKAATLPSLLKSENPLTLSLNELSIP